MSLRAPIWSAARLNEEVSHAGKASLAFTPSGEVVRLDASMNESTPRAAEGTARREDDSFAGMIGLGVNGIETVTSRLGSLPSLLACCALDPEAWCVVIVHPGALEAVGPFRDVSRPLHDWLLRAALNRLDSGRQRPGSILQWQRPGQFDRLPTLGSGSPGFPLPMLVPDAARPRWMGDHLGAFDAGRLGFEVKSPEDAVALSAGVWQMNGFLDRSHELAQSVEGRGKNKAGDYWHAIVHRREPDYSNAKYWCRRVGQHGIHPDLARDADDILSGSGSVDAPRWRSALTGNGQRKWNASAFVDLCEESANGHDAELSQAARQIQLIEMALLLSSTYHDAVS